MRVIVLVKADEKYEGGAMPTAEMISAMSVFNQELADAGVIQLAEGLTPSSRGARVSFDGHGESDFEYGPFPHPTELVSGFWIWKVDSLEHAIGWLKRAPFRHAVVEIRPVFDPADFGEALTPELRERERALRARTEP